MQTLEWFKERIGKRIFRDADGCDCSGCAKVVSDGLVVHNEFHADYLFTLQADFMAEGIKLNYRDEK